MLYEFRLDCKALFSNSQFLISRTSPQKENQTSLQCESADRKPCPSFVRTRMKCDQKNSAFSSWKRRAVTERQPSDVARVARCVAAAAWRRLLFVVWQWRSQNVDVGSTYGWSMGKGVAFSREESGKELCLLTIIFADFCVRNKKGFSASWHYFE